MIARDRRQTKVVWSIDSRSLDDKVGSKAVSNEEVDSLRISYHPDSIDKIINFITSLKGSVDRSKFPTPILIDVATELRGVVCGIDEAVDFAYGQEITVSDSKGSGDLKIDCDDFKSLLCKDALLYVGHGYVTVKITSISEKSAKAEVIAGGMVHPEMLVSVPMTRAEVTLEKIPSDHFQKLLEAGADAFMVSVMKDKTSYGKISSLKNKSGQSPWVFLKVDSQQVVEQLEEYLPYVQGVVVSRLDLALTLDPATIPMVTKDIVSKCIENAKVVMTASEMLGSMKRNPTPTRAEVSDIANAVLDGTDAVVLSEDVATGKYGAEAVSAMADCIVDAESQPRVGSGWSAKSPTMIDHEVDAVSYAAYRTAERVGAKAIVCITEHGNTALRLASFRAPVPIMAVTFSSDIHRKLTLVRGVDALLLENDPTIDQILPVVSEKLLKESWLKPKDRIVFVSISLSSVGREQSNLFTVQTIN